MRKCRHPKCTLCAHTTEDFGGFCCGRCRLWLRDYAHKRPVHGCKCESLQWFNSPVQQIAREESVLLEQPRVRLVPAGEPARTKAQRLLNSSDVGVRRSTTRHSDERSRSAHKDRYVAAFSASMRGRSVSSSDSEQESMRRSRMRKRIDKERQAVSVDDHTRTANVEKELESNDGKMDVRQKVTAERGHAGDLDVLLKAKVSEMETLQRIVAVESGCADDLEVQLKAKDDEMVILQQTVAAERCRAGDLEVQLKTKDGAMEALQQDVATLRCRIGDLELQLKTKDGDMEALQQSVAAERCHAGDLVIQLKAKDGKVEALQQIVAAERCRVGDFEVQLKTKDCEMEDLQQIVAAERCRGGDLEMELKNKDSEVNPLRQKLAAERRRAGDLKTQLDSKAREMEALRESLADESRHLGDLEMQLESKVGEMQAIQQSLATERCRSADLAMQLKAKGGEMKNLLQNLAAERCRTGDLGTQLQTMDAEMNNLEDIIAAKRLGASDHELQLEAKVVEMKAQQESVTAEGCRANDLDIQPEDKKGLRSGCAEQEKEVAITSETHNAECLGGEDKEALFKFMSCQQEERQQDKHQCTDIATSSAQPAKADDAEAQYLRVIASKHRQCGGYYELVSEDRGLLYKQCEGNMWLHSFRGIDNDWSIGAVDAIDASTTVQDDFAAAFKFAALSLLSKDLALADSDVQVAYASALPHSPRVWVRVMTPGAVGDIPKEQRECEGCYGLVTDAYVGGQPLYHQRGGHFFLFSGPDKKWHVAHGFASLTSFSEASCVLSSSLCHGGQGADEAPVSALHHGGSLAGQIYTWPWVGVASRLLVGPENSKPTAEFCRILDLFHCGRPIYRHVAGCSYLYEPEPGQFYCASSVDVRVGKDTAGNKTDDDFFCTGPVSVQPLKSRNIVDARTRAEEIVALQSILLAERVRSERTSAHLLNAIMDTTEHKKRCKELEVQLQQEKRIRQHAFSIQGIFFEYEAGLDDWYPVGVEANEKYWEGYVAHMSRGQPCTQVRSGGTLYSVNFDLMVQTNVDTRTKRQIRLKSVAPSSWSSTPFQMVRGMDPGSFYVQDGSDGVRDIISVLLMEAAHRPSESMPSSPCYVMQRARVINIWRVENFILWRKYLQHIQSMELDSPFPDLHTPVRPDLGSNDPFFAELLDILNSDCPLHLSVNERWLFHGTSHDSAHHIIASGFDHRVASSRSMYGSGTYFASQACKSHQYTCKSHHHACTCPQPRTMILARVALGNPFYTSKVDYQMRRPPLQGGSTQPYGCVIANPGVVQGHPKGIQDHQEFIIFNDLQAYPAYIFTYTVAACNMCK